MSFSEDCVRFGDRLATLVDAGVLVRDAAVSLRISQGRCYAILRATGRPAGSARAASGDVGAAQAVAVFIATGSINQAAKACGVSHGVARRLLVAEGLVSATRQPGRKAEAKRRFFELLASGWSATRAARKSVCMNAPAVIGAMGSARSATRGCLPMARSSTTRPGRDTHSR